MAWFSARGFTSAVTSAMDQSVVVEGWRCGFVPPESLAPSKNTASVGKCGSIARPFHSTVYSGLSTIP